MDTMCVFYLIQYTCTRTITILCYAEGEEGGEGSAPEQDETLLDSWIKELESGIKGMADLAGVPSEVSNMYTLRCACTSHVCGALDPRG